MKRDLRLRLEKQAHNETKLANEGKVRALKAELSETRSLLKTSLKNNKELEREFNLATKVLQDLKSPPPIKPRNRSKSKSETTAVVLASDWHIEEEVRPGQVNGLNTYNLEVAERRAEAFFRNTLGRVNAARSETKIEDLVCWMGGDFITGHIHEENKEITQVAPLEAILILKGMWTRGIDFWLEHGKFSRIVIPCTPGNHGRLTRKPYYAHAAKHNLEWYLYLQLVDHYRDDDRVEFHVNESLFNTEVVVYGRRIRFHHGEKLGFQGGQQGTYGRLSKKHNEWNRSEQCAYTFVGHWHQHMTFHELGGVNGSLIGINAYSMGFGTYQPPLQTIVFIEKTRGWTSGLPIYVE